MKYHRRHWAQRTMEYWFSLYDVCSKVIHQKRGRTKSVIMLDFRQRYSNLRITNVLSLDSFETHQFLVLFFFVLWSTAVQEISKNQRKTPTKNKRFNLSENISLSKVFKKLFLSEGVVLTFWKILNLAITDVLWIDHQRSNVSLVKDLF